MRLWRISSYPGLSGEGGMHVSGRWHTVGRRVIYAAEHPALALVETMAHMRLALTDIPTSLKMIAIDVADGFTCAAALSLPPGWQANEPTSRMIGDRWLQSGSDLIHPVPSAIIGHATNYLINCAHPSAAGLLTEASIEPLWIDARFFR